MTTVVLVHGAFHDAWCWGPVRTLLDDRGVPNQALDLPFTGLDGDAEAVAELLDAIDGLVVLCGHSYGGMVISRAASGRDDVSHLVYLCAVQVLDDAELAATMRPTLVMEHFLVDEEVGTTVDPAFAVECFYHDCSPDLAAGAAARLRPMRGGVGPIDSEGAESVVPAWKAIPSTYVVCTDDRTLHPDTQRAMARNATRTVEWDTSHSPMLSQPDLVADLLADLAGGTS